MASYFRQVPNLAYVSRDKNDQYLSQYTLVKNLFKRGKLREDIFGNLAFFEKYSIIGDERPDNVAYKFYNDETLDWVILVSNNILNIQTEWPLTQRVFDEYLIEKYRTADISDMYFISGGTNYAQLSDDEVTSLEKERIFNDESIYNIIYNGVHHFETIEIKNSLGITILKPGIKITPGWKTNGNFIEYIRTTLDNLYAGDGVNPTTTITVNPNGSVPDLKVGSKIIIDGVPEKEYNGEFEITQILFDNPDNGTVYTFTYEVPKAPTIAYPTLSVPRKEQLISRIAENSNFAGNVYYYEYWDDGLKSIVTLPLSEFITPITNYEYEKQLEEQKRNIYILKPRYLSIVFEDMKDLMTYKKGGDQYVNPTLKKGDNIKLYT